MENRISIIVPKEVEVAFLTKIAEAAELLKPYIVTVTDADKETLLKLGDKLTPFVKKCFDYTKTDPEYIPNFLDLKEYEKDATALQLFDVMNSSVDKMNAGLDDTRALLAHDSYAESLMYYHFVKMAAASGDAKAKVIYEDLKKWFPGRGRGSKNEG
jgi:hypothetical protein